MSKSLNAIKNIVSHGDQGVRITKAQPFIIHIDQIKT